ncbi:MAG: fibronectin type III domain-containing protein [Thermoplasmatales archaeon]|nr:fibronectin type III domain-containing protein [Thermoplasmatales archaeon]
MRKKLDMKKFFLVCITILFLALPVNAEEKQNVRVSNISSSSVVISWVADEKCTGAVHYGVSTDALNLTETDNSRRENCVIMVELKGLTPNTAYYFEVVSGDSVDNNSGSYYTFRTAEISEGISMPSPVLYGQVLLDSGENADGTMVYATVGHDGMNSTPLSCMVFEGYWMVELSALKHENGTAFEWEINDTLYIEIEGGKYGYKNVTTVITGEEYQNCTTPTGFKALPKPVASRIKADAEEYNRILIIVFCIVLFLIIMMVYIIRRKKLT